jgi:hypothetical protein
MAWRRLKSSCRAAPVNQLGRRDILAHRRLQGAHPEPVDTQDS